MRPAFLLLFLVLSLPLFAVEVVPSRHIPATVAAAAPPLAAGKRVPFGWQTGQVDAQSGIGLTWPGLPADVMPTRLRITVGVDVRDGKLVEVRLARSGRLLGTFDIRFASLFGLFEIPLAASDVPAVRDEGVVLRLTRGAPLRIFTAGPALPPELAPHLLVPGTRAPFDEFLARLRSFACVQSFGWMEGCVVDGLLDLAERPGHADLQDVVRDHFAHFIIDGRLVYESPTSDIADGRIYGIEGSLPFAALARIEPRHALLDLPVTFWRGRGDADGAIIDGHHTSSEGAYTVGYPLAVVGRARGDADLEQRALVQLRTRQQRLFDGSTFWRTREADGKMGNRNWARGIAWQLVGQVRTLRVLRDRPDIAEDIAAFQALAAWTLKSQRADGLWSVFVDAPPLTQDTAGSAGIAAAFALGAAQGWLGPEYHASAERTLAALCRHLTPDGFLGGASQSNKGGEGLQRGDYRVIYQMAMGLMAQLVAALPER